MMNRRLSSFGMHLHSEIPTHRDGASNKKPSRRPNSSMDHSIQLLGIFSSSESFSREQAGKKKGREHSIGLRGREASGPQQDKEALISY